MWGDGEERDILELLTVTFECIERFTCPAESLTIIISTQNTKQRNKPGHGGRETIIPSRVSKKFTQKEIVTGYNKLSHEYS